MNDISQELLEMALKFGLCDEYKEKFLKDSSIANLAKMYKKGFDFVLEHNYPSLTYMEKHLKGVFRDYEIYISEEFYEKNPTEVILNGSCNGMVECDFDFCVVRVRHNSKVDIKAINNARMRVFIYDKGEVNIVEKDDTSRISVIQRGGKLNTNGYNVKLITPKTTY
jgi:hypothetical protein